MKTTNIPANTNLSASSEQENGQQKLTELIVGQQYRVKKTFGNGEEHWQDAIFSHRRSDASGGREVMYFSKADGTGSIAVRGDQLGERVQGFEHLLTDRYEVRRFDKDRVDSTYGYKALAKGALDEIDRAVPFQFYGIDTLTGERFLSFNAVTELSKTNKTEQQYFASLEEPDFTLDHRKALVAFRDANGPQWKSKLNHCWTTGNYRGIERDQAALLQQVRNRLGPEWLSKAKPQDYEVMERHLDVFMTFNQRDIEPYIYDIQKGVSHIPKWWSVTQQDRDTIAKLFANPRIVGGSVRFSLTVEGIKDDVESWAELAAELARKVHGTKFIHGGDDELHCTVAVGGLREDVQPVVQKMIDKPIVDDDEVAENLRTYLNTPELVEGWITPQALMLKNGALAATEYFKTPRGGYILRESLVNDEPENYGRPHPESTAGLIARFEAGERYVPKQRPIALAADNIESPNATGREKAHVIVLSPQDDRILSFIAEHYMYARMLRGALEPDEERVASMGDGLEYVYVIDDKAAREIKSEAEREPDGYLPMMAGTLKKTMERLLNAIENEYTVTVWREQFTGNRAPTPRDAADMGTPDRTIVEADHVTWNEATLLQHARQYRIDSLVGNGSDQQPYQWFRSNQPHDDPQAPNQGINAYYSIHINAINGREPTPTAMLRLAQSIGIDLGKRVENDATSDNGMDI
jgi:hypothetical protein